MKTQLQHILERNHFAVTAEIGPPKNANSRIIENKANQLKGFADAFNITDNQTAVVRLSSIAGSIILKQLGLEPIFQLSCRDRNPEESARFRVCLY